MNEANQHKNKIKESFKSRAFYAGSYSTLASAAVIAIAVVAVLLVQKLPSKYTQLDMTANGLYSLSEQTEQIVSGIDKEVSIYLIAQQGNEDENISKLLDKYDDLSDKIKVEKKDPVTYPGFAKKYTESKVNENSLVVECGEKNKFIAYSDIYKVQYDYSTGSASSADFDGENMITSAVNSVTSDKMPKLYTLTGHGESGFSSALNESIKNENYDSEELGLLTASDVPEDASALIINAPKSDISAEEKDIILAYMKNGGRLLLLTDHSEAETPNLNELAAYYGARRTGAMVFDPDSSHSMRGYFYYLLPEIESHEITAPLSQRRVLAPMAEGLEKTEETREGLTVTELLKTSSSAYAKKKVSDGASVEKAPDDINGPFAVGIASEEKIDGEEEKKARFVWISAAQMAQDQINQLVSGTNGDLIMNSVGWMCENEEMISIRAKSMETEHLTVSTGAASILGIVTIGLIPAAVVIAGVYVWIRRRRR